MDPVREGIYTGHKNWRRPCLNSKIYNRAGEQLCFKGNPCGSALCPTIYSCILELPILMTQLFRVRVYPPVRVNQRGRGEVEQRESVQVARQWLRQGLFNIIHALFRFSAMLRLSVRTTTTRGDHSQKVWWWSTCSPAKWLGFLWICRLLVNQTAFIRPHQRRPTKSEFLTGES